MKSYSDLFEELYSHFEGDYQSVTNFLATLPKGAVMEIGAGSGRILKLLDSINQDILLVEPDVHMVQKLIKCKGDYKILSDYSYHLPVEDRSIAGIIYAFGSFAEMHPQFFSLSEASRVLIDGGKIYIATGNPKAFRTSSLGLFRSVEAKAHSSISAEAIPRLDRGSFEYDVIVTNRLIGSHHKYIVDHVYPNLQWWQEILESLDFEIENIFDTFTNNLFQEDSSKLIRIVAKKKTSKTMKNPVNDFYNSIAHKYDQIWPTSEYRVPNWLKEVFTPLKEFHPRILDLGCGSGIVGDILGDLNLRPSYLFGVDLSEQMVCETRKKGTYTAVAKYDLSKGLPDKKSNLYDIVTACGVFEFLSDKRPAIKDIFTQLDVGGMILATFEACTSLDSDVEAVETPLGTITRFRVSEEVLVNLVEAVGFKVINLRKEIGYKSPSTGKLVDYFLLEARKVI